MCRMLWIFDLDDTLLDTSAALTRWLEKQFLKQAVFKVHHLNAVAPNFQKVLEEITELDPICGEKLQVAYRKLQQNPAQLEIAMAKGAHNVLQYLSEKYTLALVTRGIPGFQREKMQRARLPLELFREVCVVLGGKQQCYESLSKKLHMQPEQVVVVGDRMHVDLLPAQKLGFTTVHVRQGRGLRSEGTADFAVDSLEALYEIAEQIECRNFLRHI